MWTPLKRRAACDEARDLSLAELREACELHKLELKAEKEKALLAAELEAAACGHELKIASLGRHSHMDRAIARDPVTLLEILD